jgi:hypothetical protein
MFQRVSGGAACPASVVCAITKDAAQTQIVRALIAVRHRKRSSGRRRVVRSNRKK